MDLQALCPYLIRYGSGINDLGQVSGTMWVSGQRRAFRYDPDDGTFHNLGVLTEAPKRNAPWSETPLGGGWTESPGSINNAGQVVGSSLAATKGAGNAPHAFRHTEGSGMKDDPD